MLIYRDRIALEVADSRSGGNVCQRQLGDNVTKQLGGEKHCMRGSLVGFLVDRSRVRQVRRAKCAALSDFSLTVWVFQGGRGVEGVRRVVWNVCVVWSW